MLLIPAITCLSLITQFSSKCNDNIVTSDRIFFWRALCKEDFEMIKWSNDAVWIDLHTDTHFPNEEIVCRKGNELVILSK